MSASRAQRLVLSSQAPRYLHQETLHVSPRSLHGRHLYSSSHYGSISLRSALPTNRSPHHDGLSRAFSTTPPRPGPGGGRKPATAGRVINYNPKQKAQPSLAVARKQAMAKATASGQAAAEVGVLPGTFISCRRSERPSLWKAPEDRWMWEKARITAFAMSAYTLAASKLYLVRLKSPAQLAEMERWERIKYFFTGWYGFDMWRMNRIAKEMYVDMYTALAEGRVDSVRDTLKGGMYQSLKGREVGRGRHEVWQWEVTKWNTGPKLRSYVAMLLETGRDAWKQNMIQQAVVEIDTRQRLRRFRRVLDSKGKETGLQEVKGFEDDEHTVRELIVLHRSMVDGKPGRWMIWGMTKSTLVLDLKKEYRERMGIAERLG